MSASWTMIGSGTGLASTMQAERAGSRVKTCDVVFFTMHQSKY